MKQVQINWFKNAVGRSMNPDKAFNLTCVDAMNDYAEHIFGAPWHVAVGGVNGAKDLLRVANRKYWEVIYEKPGDAAWLPQGGDVIVYGNAHSFGHTLVAESTTPASVTGMEQNGTGDSLVPCARVTRGYVLPDAGPVIGWLRPRPEMVIEVHAPAPAVRGVKTLTVSAGVAVVRTSPRIEPGNVAPGYLTGLAKGAKVAAVGYVAGQDPYPNDGVPDNAWVKTVSGYYIWANALGNDLSGLPAV